MSNNNNNSKRDIVACLNCRKNHKKCDGKRPCEYCAKRKVECLENQKRKPTGRPKKSETDKKIKIDPFQLKCTKCEAKQNDGAKFCSQCGDKLPEIQAINTELYKENEILKQKNEQLMKIVELKESSLQIWFLLKMIPYEMKQEKKLHPSPSFIIDCSPLFLNLLGYKTLNNAYYPDLVAKKHHTEFCKDEQFNIDVIENQNVPKLTWKHNMVMRHSQGHYVNIIISSTAFVDKDVRPNVTMVYVENILNTRIEENEIPPFTMPTDIKYFGVVNEESPDIIKNCLHRTKFLKKKDLYEDLTQNENVNSNNDIQLHALANVSVAISNESNFRESSVDFDLIFSNF